MHNGEIQLIAQRGNCTDLFKICLNDTCNLNRPKEKVSTIYLTCKGDEVSVLVNFRRGEYNLS